MAALALAFVLVPLLRARAVGGPSSREAALEALRGQRREIERDIAAGTLPADAREEALAELVARAGEDLGSTEAERAASTGRPWAVAAVAAVAIPAIAFGLYGAIGSPRASDPRTLEAAKPDVDQAQVVAMVENLARKVRERPDDVQGWSLLARSMAAIGRFQESADAYEHLAKLVPGDAQVLADWADSLGMAQGRTLRGRPAELAAQALRIDPDNHKALALAATAAMDAGEFATALGYWQRIAAQLPAGSEDAAKVEAILVEVRGRAATAGQKAPAPQAVAKAPGKAPASGAAAKAPKAAPAPEAVAKGPEAGTAKSVSGSVALDASLAAKVNGSETLFVFARAEGGPRVPLAVMRVAASALPLEFALDDSQAMAPGMNISSTQALRVEARISRSGNAVAQPGDLVGTSAVIQPGARGVKVVVDKVLP
jgi:cytochrome c-type biogenesis protein CcmH